MPAKEIAMTAASVAREALEGKGGRLDAAPGRWCRRRCRGRRSAGSWRRASRTSRRRRKGGGAVGCGVAAVGAAVGCGRWSGVAACPAHHRQALVALGLRAAAAAASTACRPSPDRLAGQLRCLPILCGTPSCATSTGRSHAAGWPSLILPRATDTLLQSNKKRCKSVS